MIYRERGIIKFCVCKMLRFCVCEMPAAARGLQGSEANSLRQNNFEPQTCRLTEWFLVLHFAAKAPKRIFRVFGIFYHCKYILVY